MKYGSREFPDWNPVSATSNTATERVVGAGVGKVQLSLSGISTIADYLPGLVDSQMALWLDNLRLRGQTIGQQRQIVPAAKHVLTPDEVTLSIAKTKYVVVIPPFFAATSDAEIALSATWTRRTRDSRTGAVTDTADGASFTATRQGGSGVTQFEVPADGARDLSTDADTVTLRDLVIQPLDSYAAPVLITAADS